MQFGLVCTAQADNDAFGPETGQGFRDYLDFNVEAEALGFYSSFLVTTRDVVIIEGILEFIPVDGDDELANAHTEAAGFDPRRTREDFVYIRLTPRKIQAWREENEPGGPVVMIDGLWLA